MSDEIPIGPNRCVGCGGEYGEHAEDCRSLAPAQCSAAVSDKVAILATKQNLEDMLIALDGAVWNGLEVQRRCKALAAGMRQLLHEAFPPNDADQRRPENL